MMMILVILFLFFASPAIAQVQALTRGANDRIWAAEAERLFLLEGTSQIVPWYNGGAAIQTLLADQDGDDLWIGTEQGLFRCNIGSRKCEFDSRIPKAPILALAQGTGSVWIATSEKLYRIKNNTITSAALPSNRIEAMAAGADDVVWLGTRSSVQMFRDDSFQEMLKSSAQAIAIQRANGVVWIGAGHELVRYENGKTETFSLPPPPANVRMRPPITSILPAQSGEIYVGTHGGLLQRSGNTFRKVLEEEVFSLLEDRKGTIWVGTSEGLKKIVNGKIVNIPLPPS